MNCASRVVGCRLSVDLTAHRRISRTVCAAEPAAVQPASRRRYASTMTTREAQSTDNRQRAKRNQPTTDNAQSAA